MNLIFYLIIFIFGSCIGSFLNCVIYRLNTKESFLFSRSHCPKCHHILKWYDLIPILSFIIVKGKCRYCQKPISLQYPLVELATGILFVSIFSFQFSRPEGARLAQLYWAAIFNLIISCFLIVIFVYDLKHYIIPDKIIYPAILVSGIWYFVSGIFFNLYTKYEILDTIYSAIGAAAFFLTIVLISHEKWMGWGDVKLGFFMGLFLSWPNILAALFSAFFIGAIIGIGLIIAGKKTLKSQVPFGPFLVIGTFIALFWGQNLINWYINFIV